MKLGAQLYSLRTFLQTPEDIRTTFQKVKAIGYENVQLSGNAPTDAKILKSISEECELPIVITHSPIDRIINDTEALIADHKTFGCPVIGLGVMPDAYRGSLAGLDEFLKVMKEPVKKIHDAGLGFAYHNHAFELTPTEGDDRLVLDVMLEKCTDWGFIMDTYWVEFAGFSAVDYIAKIGKERLTNIHFKDLANNEARSICSCGNGTLDFKTIYEACVKMDVQNVLVEQDNAVDTPDAFAEMAKSFAHLRPIVH